VNDMSVGHKVDVSRTASLYGVESVGESVESLAESVESVESVGESEESVGQSVVSVRSASDTSICLLCAAFPSVLLLCARSVFGVCNGLRRCLRLLCACTFTLPAWLRVAYGAVPFPCGRVWCDCTTCVRCGCTTCVLCGFTAGYTSDYTTRVRYVVTRLVCDV